MYKFLVKVCYSPKCASLKYVFHTPFPFNLYVEEEVLLTSELRVLSGGGTPSAGGTPASPVATVHGSSGEAGSGAGSIFAPGVIQITPQDKEAIERVSTHMEV
jgi:hypothetical protein